MSIIKKLSLQSTGKSFVLLAAVLAMSCPQGLRAKDKDEKAAKSDVVGEPVALPGGPEEIAEVQQLLPDDSSDVDIFAARIFMEPLVPMDWEPVEGENRALARALSAFAARTDRDEVSMLDAFVKEYPTSRWRAAVQMNAGMLRRKAGYFEEALQRLEEAWAMSKTSTSAAAQGIANRSLGELADLYARFGRVQRMGEILAEADARDISGSAGARIEGVKEGYWRMQNMKEEAFRCGPFALNAVLDAGKDPTPNPVISQMPSTENGTNLQDLENVAEQLGMKYVVAKREEGAAWPVPMLVHWKVGHFAAITEKVGDRYLVVDPTFGGEIWVKEAALESESTGYGLVSEKLPKGWTAVGDEEGAKVWGRGGADGRADGTDKCKTGCGGKGMAVYAIQLMKGVLEVTDYPVGYKPPVGPEVEVGVRYADLEDGQPQNFNFTNFGPYWVSNWISYIEVAAGGSITLRARGGGTDLIAGSSFDPVQRTYRRSFYSGSQFRLASPSRYEFRRKDGGTDVYGYVDGVTGRIFLSEVIDGQGNKVSIVYDGNARIQRIVDAIGGNTTFTYKSQTLAYGVGGQDLNGFFKVASITDPFGRSALFTYDSANTRLAKITDVVNIESSFSYGANGFVNRLTTPYGNTDFYKYTPAEDTSGRGLLVVLPDGSQEALESYIGHTKSSFHWDRKAMAMGRGDRSKATQYNWLIRSGDYQMVDAPEWIKKANEGQVNFKYPDQAPPTAPPPSLNEPPGTLHSYTGSLRDPSEIRRTLDDGSEQVTRYEYNELGRVTKFTDAMGRTFDLLYSANNIDLLEVRGSDNDLLFKATYNGQKRPLTQSDASGRKTTFTYNTRGQILTITRPAASGSETTTLTYDTNGYLTRIDGPLSGTNDRTDISYAFGGNPYGRYGLPTSITKVEGPNAADQWTVGLDYDNLDRLRIVTFPDGTYEETIYNRLDVARTRDRQNRWTNYASDALGQVVAMTDPSGRTTQYEWCRCGALQGLTDAAGNLTKWAYDVQGRLIGKTYADGTGETYEYEQTISRIARFIDPQGSITNYTYAKDNRVTKVEWTPAANVDDVPDVTVTWDSKYPRIASVSSNATSSNSTDTYTYLYKPYTSSSSAAASNGRGQIESITNSALGNATLAFTYDNLGRMNGRTVDGSANPMTWAFDAAGRLGSMTNPLGTFTPTYVNAGYGVDRIESLALPNGAVTSYQWEPNTGDFRLKQIKNLGTGNATISKMDYVTDVLSRVQRWTQQVDAATPVQWDFSYNRRDELTGASLRDTGTQAIVKTYGYSYDAASNRKSTQVDNSVKKADFNNVNQITSSDAGGAARFQGSITAPGSVTVGGQAAWMTGATNFAADVPLNVGTNTVAIVARDGGTNSRTNSFKVVVPAGTTKSYTFSTAGNLLSDGSRTYRWDAANRMTKITYSGNATTEFTYDAFGRRTKIVEKDAGGTVTSTKQFVWDGLQIAEERDGANAVTKRFYQEGFRDVVAGASYFYTRDHLGSIREVLNSSASVVARYGYDPYGQVTKLSGSVDADFLYTGHYYHLASGLFLAPYRAYDAALGRWLSRDPIGEAGGINLYGYVANNPVNWADRLGLCYGPYPGVNIPTTEQELRASREGLTNGTAMAVGAGLGLAIGEPLAIYGAATAIVAGQAARAAAIAAAASILSNPQGINNAANAINHVGEFAMGYGLPDPPRPNGPSILGASLSNLPAALEMFANLGNKSSDGECAAP